jgi:hypothetical protein
VSLIAETERPDHRSGLLCSGATRFTQAVRPAFAVARAPGRASVIRGCVSFFADLWRDLHTPGTERCHNLGGRYVTVTRICALPLALVLLLGVVRARANHQRKFRNELPVVPEERGWAGACCKIRIPVLGEPSAAASDDAASAPQGSAMDDGLGGSFPGHGSTACLARLDRRRFRREVGVRACTAGRSQPDRQAGPRQGRQR